MRLLFALGFLTVVLQRIGLPIGDRVLPLPPLIIGVAFAFLLVRGGARLVPVRVVGFALFLALAGLGAVMSGGGQTSFLQVAIIWAPIVFSLEAGGPRRFLGGVVAATLLGAALGLMQSGLTMVGGPLIDPIGTMPERLLVPGFNSTYEVVYGSGWMKANGMFFLEPSLLSLFGGLAALAILARAVDLPRWLKPGLGVLLAFLGVLSAVAVSTLVLAPAYLVWIVRNFRRALPWLVGVAAVLPLFLMLPQADVFLARAQDTETSSNDARLVRPYTEFVPIVVDAAPWMGFGPGAARIAAVNRYDGWQTEVTTPTAVKVLFEYGLVGLALLGAAVVSLWNGSRVPIELRLGVVIALIIPTDGLASGIIAPFALLVLAKEHGGDKTQVEAADAAAEGEAPQVEAARPSVLIGARS
ncbi:hypothetical protein [Demequina rhizosphaerae]|uniref:hypothetical protein n=1 Tax=Demequina rhizosphaerae TaxID=1638985 RepID=UPI000784CDC8|nr:hypothetical protein [Demequina rhizosphaerae]